MNTSDAPRGREANASPRGLFGQATEEAAKTREFVRTEVARLRLERTPLLLRNTSREQGR